MSGAPRVWAIAQQFVLRTASFIVPSYLRKEWRAEWDAELWHIQQRTGDDPLSFRFCLGAWSDAYALRRLSEPRHVSVLHTPRRCLGVLAAIAVFSISLCCLDADARSQLFLESSAVTPAFAILTPAGDSRFQPTTFPGEEFASLQESKTAEWSELASMQPFHVRARVAGHEARNWAMETPSANLFRMLGVHPWIPTTSCGTDHGVRQPYVLLSSDAWHLHFGSSSTIFGHSITIDGVNASVCGVVDAKALHVFGGTDGWFFPAMEGQRIVGVNAPRYALARIKAAEMENHPDGEWTVLLSAKSESRVPPIFLGSLGWWSNQENHEAMHAFLRTLLFSLLIFWAADAPSQQKITDGALRHRLHFPAAMFFLVKSLLIMGSVCANTLLVGNLLGVSRDLSAMLQIITSFVMCLVGICWALSDQRRRCPQCLHRLVLPTRVGQSSLSFPSWSGTELVCAQGHGVLHIPAFATSWFKGARWVKLDCSWRQLFCRTESL